jgi:hypothetical protein
VDDAFDTTHSVRVYTQKQNPVRRYLRLNMIRS